jgi:RNA polymerase sigma-70 factor (ECF subfamily)
MATADLDRLSQISTRWTLVAEAGRADGGREALAALLPRYCPPVYSYLLGIVRDEELAAELCQEFALRFVRGDFRNARPERGRFRDYLRVSVQRLARDQIRRRRARERLLPFDSGVFLGSPDPWADLEAGFVESWRQNLLNRAWAALEQASADAGRLDYEALRMRADDPTQNSGAIAEALARRHGREFTAAGVRQVLHRARERFTEMLRREVGESLPSDDPAEVDEELAALGLLVYCRGA